MLIATAAFPASAKRKAHHAPTPNKGHLEAATRLQIFLDRANFSPGTIDGRYNEVTKKALALYRESRGEQAQTAPSRPNAKSNAAPDVNGLDLASAEPVFIPYTVNEADLQSIGPLPKDAAQQAKTEIQIFLLRIRIPGHGMCGIIKHPRDELSVVHAQVHEHRVAA